VAQSLAVIVADPAWQKTIPGAERIVRRAAHAAGMQGTIVLASNRLVQDLNWRHRGKNKPTNVLTYEEPAPEIVLAHGVVHAEARVQRRRAGHHLAHLVVHGALHLQGEDHEHPGDARRMEMLESRILHRIGVPNPWKRA
jgi:probable rRNA maturation factor